MRLSVIVPMYNERRTIVECLRSIRGGAPQAELIVVDGGSSDESRSLAAKECGLVMSAPRGRASQMNAGANRANGSVLAFVHADTLVPRSFANDIQMAACDDRVVGGRFDVELDDPRWPYRIIGRMINLRSRLSRTGTGDQAIFVRRGAFERLGGFADIALCEDLEFSRRLKRLGQVACLRSRVITSARKWRDEGFLRTIVGMWAVRLLFLAGASPEILEKIYRGRQSAETRSRVCDEDMKR